ncbi:MAG: branched-chain amino acid ABC transporter ATP-binding protein [Desulfobacteraceae bacterium 4484_190.1]|nr:ABC transporter ATP-binding protein [Deltaproteobacteria bacterium]OPX36538.1 MAG: branched-chain amino acid ABC transporter ATP-binding protein [Desulfobacteraceae bacterium 4484_190.1]
MLEMDRIRACYGAIQVLWDVSFRVEEGEIVTLLGSNGAGKSTAIHVAQGLVRPASGEARFRGDVIGHLRPHQVVERGLCLVPEARHLFPYMSVLENLELGAYPKKARAVRESTLQWIFELFPILQKRQKQRAHTLSGGEQQMVAIARGLMAKPYLLMMDEPSLGLAPLIVAELFRTISEVNQHGLSILLVEQNAMHALNLAARAYVMETGRITRQGSGKELLDDPHIRTAYLGM